jgi:hypothetical protein
MPDNCRFALSVTICLWPALACAEAPSFERDVASVLEQRCVRCHHGESSKGGFALDVREKALAGGDSGPAIVAGEPDASLILDMISGDKPEMPKQGPPLKPEQVELIRKWIAGGAVWPDGRTLIEKSPQHLDWWSLQPVKRPAPPEVANASWVRNPIDQFVLAKLEAAGLSPSPETDRRTLLRRLSLDLWGMPPTPEDVARFLAAADADAYERLVDEHLQSIHFGERYAAHWLDVVRFAETNGFETNVERPNAWHYRDYVIRAFAEDKPYDRFLQEQLAGDVLGADVATGFLVGGAADQVRSPDPVLTANQRADELHDMVSTTGSTFLGLTVGCARCHDHKFDPIPQREYYAIKAVFEGVQHGDRELKSLLTPQRASRLAELKAESDEVERQLSQFEPLASPRRIMAIHHDDPRVTQLLPTDGIAKYADGDERGAVGFRGNGGHLPTIGKGYLYWHAVASRDVLAWSPAVVGTFRIWASWGCGWNTQATDAKYVLDQDGDLTTAADQTVIATVNQQRFANGSGDVPNKPLWSGLANLGSHGLSSTSKLLLRAGATDAYVAADVLLLEEIGAGDSSQEQLHLRATVSAGANVERFAPVDARFVRFTVSATTDIEPCLDELEVFTAEAKPRNVALASLGTKATSSGNYSDTKTHKLEQVNDGQYGNSRSWISNESGRGWVQLELPQVHRVDRIVWSRDRSVPRRYEDRVATEYKVDMSMDGSTWTTVATSGDRLPRGTPVPGGMILAGSMMSTQQVDELLRQRSKLAAEIGELSQSPSAYCGQMTTPGMTRLLHRGDPMQPMEQVEPGAIAAVNVKFEIGSTAQETPQSEAQRRLALAHWIVDRNNPLTARVIVNRLWQWHFGDGLVDTPSDFGVNGAPPSNRELLDWLACELVENNWSLRHIHRLIVTSATYRQSSLSNDAGLAKDAGSRLLWRFPPRRLEAEALRDTMLTVSGNLDLAPGGPSINPFQPNDNYVRVYTPKTEFSGADFRRMIYQRRVRMQVDPTFGVFDCPDGGQVAPKRGRSTTPLQALNLLNSAFVLEQAKLFEARLQQERPNDATAQVRHAFELAFQREPTDVELSASTAAAEQHGLVIFCRALLNSNEFAFLE